MVFRQRFRLDFLSICKAFVFFWLSIDISSLTSFLLFFFMIAGDSCFLNIKKHLQLPREFV